jgi:cell division protein FtsA
MIFGFKGLRKGAGKQHYALSLDIGTEFVKALIYKIEGDKGIVVGAGRQRQRLSDMQGGKVTDIAGCIANCEEALGQAAEMAKVAPKQCVIGIAGELVKGTTTTVHYERDHPRTKITVPELKGIIGQVQNRAFDKTRQALAWETGYREIDVRLVNSAVVDVRIDGYRVTNPVGFQGRDISIGVFNAFAPIVHLGALQTISEGLGLELLSIAAEPYAVARCMGLEESTDFSAIFIDIGGGTTDIAVVRNGGVEGTRMFAIGGRVFTKRIATELDKTFTEAEAKKIEYSAGKLSQKDTDKVKAGLDADCQVWLSGVELALGEFGETDLLPSKILLCGGGSLLPEIKQYLETRDWVKRLPFARQPKVDFIRPSDVVNVTDETGKMTGAADITPMALANLGIDLAGESGVVEGILDRVVGSIKE